MQFIYDHNILEDVKTFASLQSKDLSTLLSQYVGPLVKTTESVRRFGKNDVGLKALLAKATAQGATPAQIQQANAAVNGARGMVGIDGSPVLRTLLGTTLEKKITGNPVTRKVLSYTAAYENARLLPLMLLSSVVDPTGIAVRTGGDFKTAWDGFKVGMKSIYDKQTKDEIHGMLQSLGQVDDFASNEILTNKLGGGSEGGGRQINDIIFKVNGMSLLTRVTRYMALVSAHGFLVKHGAGASELSARYIGELSLRPGDAKSAGNNRVQILSDAEHAAATPAERARDDRVRQALMQFVDEAILRPTSQQAPNWFADPYMGLVTQYKTFGYAIYDQIGGRIMHELKHGNPSVLLPAMAYLPISIAAEMMRGVIQYGPGGNPHRKDWGPGQYASLGLLQAGYLGPIASYQSSAEQDMQRGRLPGTSLLGPAAQQAGQVYSTLTGQRSFGATLKSAAPAESLWKNWGGGASTATPSNRGMERRHTA